MKASMIAFAVLLAPVFSFASLAEEYENRVDARRESENQAYWPTVLKARLHAIECVGKSRIVSSESKLVPTPSNRCSPEPIFVVHAKLANGKICQSPGDICSDDNTPNCEL